jgi:hypothetical protein
MAGKPEQQEPTPRYDPTFVADYMPFGNVETRNGLSCTYATVVEGDVQGLAHPVRSFGRRLPWDAVPSLVRHRSRLLWGMRRKIE